MRNSIITFTLLFGTLSFAQSADEAQFKKLIEDSFQEIWSNLDESKISKFYTEDFLLLEDGEIWNNDSVKTAINDIKSRFESDENKANKFERINSFKFVKSESEGNIGWIAYNNYADIQMNGTNIAKIHWIESATFIKENNAWRIQSLHSTLVKDKDKK